uniref:hypothetical protein n=1 Tax=Gottfriedia luciferensis TaxID=178774 RepID=UPI0038B3FA9C
YIIVYLEIDWSGRWETPMGVAGRVRPRRLAEEAQLTPHGKRASCNGNHQHSFFQSQLEKYPLFIEAAVKPKWFFYCFLFFHSLFVKMVNNFQIYFRI